MKALFTAILLITPLFLLAQANKLFKQAFKTTDSIKKIELLEQAARSNVKNNNDYLFRALARNEIGDHLGALMDYSQIIIKKPKADVFYHRGNTRLNIGDFTGALEDFETALRLDENLIDAQFNLANIKLATQQYRAALRDINSLIKKIPFEANLYVMRASAFEALEKYQLAYLDYSLAIFYQPHISSYLDRGLFLIDMNEYTRARKDFSEVLTKDKSNTFAYFYRGVSNIFLERFEDAASDFSKAISYDSLDFDSYLGLAIAYNNMGDSKKAEKSFERANQILSIHKNIKSIEQYNESYWFQSKYYYFNLEATKLARQARMK